MPSLKLLKEKLLVIAKGSVYPSVRNMSSLSSVYQKKKNLYTDRLSWLDVESHMTGQKRLERKKSYPNNTSIYQCPEGTLAVMALHNVLSIVARNFSYHSTIYLLKLACVGYALFSSVHLAFIYPMSIKFSKSFSSLYAPEIWTASFWY